MLKLLYFPCLMLLLASAGCKQNQPDEKSKDGSGDKGGLTAMALSAEFKKDSQAADKKYKDKTITLSATVQEVFSKDETPKGHVILMLKGSKDGDGPDIECAIAKDSESKAGKLVPTQTVKLTGKYKEVGKNKESGTDQVYVFLEECKIDEVGSDPTITVSAADLAKAFATDQSAAEKKYVDSMLLVEGKFISTETLLVGQACIVKGYSKDGKTVNVAALIRLEDLGETMTDETIKLQGICDGTVMVNGTLCVKLLGAKRAK